MTPGALAWPKDEPTKCHKSPVVDSEVEPCSCEFNPKTMSNETL